MPPRAGASRPREQRALLSGVGLTFVALLTVALARTASAGAPTLTALVFPEGLRFDPVRGVLLDGDEAHLGRPPDPALALPARPLHLRAARDETLAFQVALFAASSGDRTDASSSSTVTVARVKLTPFLYASGVVAPIRSAVHREHAIRVAEPSTSPQVHALGVGDYPDALIPTATIAVPRAPGLALAWVDVFVPPDTPPGLVRAKLAIDGAGVIDVEVEVLPLTLPGRDVARLGAVSFGSFFELEKRDPKLLRRWMQLAHAHHLTVELMRPTPQKDASGALDWEGWAARVGSYVDGTAFTGGLGYDGPRAGQPITRFVAPVSEHWPAPATADGLLPSDGAAWSSALSAWERVASAKGWLDRPNATEWVVFINSLDEPKTAAKLEALAAYGPLLDAAHLTRRDHLRFRADGVLGTHIEGWPDARKVAALAAVVNLWDLHGATDTAPIALLRDAAPRAGVMFYASSSGGEPAIPPLVVDSAIAGARAWGWIVARYGLAGALNWEVDLQAGCVADPRCTGAGLNLDALLVYRGPEVGRAAFEPIPSLRLKALRRGADDVRLLALLRDRAPEAADALAARMIPRALGDDLPNTGRGLWPRDAKTFDAAREELLDRLSGRTPVEVRPPGILSLRAGIALIVLVGGASIVLAIRWLLRRSPPWAR